MVGMNTAIASGTGESVGVGFAIPVAIIARVVPELIRNGHVVRADAGIAQVYQTDEGLLISMLVPGGAAERAGLKGPQLIRRRRQQGPFVWDQTQIDRSAADLIVGVDGEPVKTAGDFMALVESKRPGDRITIDIIRGGRPMSVPLQLAASQ
jgi:S1-C subfamily serine protease